ncbi:cold inducible RNA binding protein a isoform X4 [Tachysurus vachellii]|uniref:cold inducible RNA binding protein a isoform X4 n=1 Tax=Tachysurus vachellii TaxID=175792 RepID=UPI00296A99C9|nr:cold inducible RNA binding protein a isoform X4 [Tachysurus vachellii]
MENLWTAGQSEWTKLERVEVAALEVVDTEVAVEEEEGADTSVEVEGEVVAAMAVAIVAIAVATVATAAQIVVMVEIGDIVVATRVEVVAAAVEDIIETGKKGVPAMETVATPTETTMMDMTGEYCSSELASTGAVLEVQLAVCHVHPHSSRGISALLDFLHFFKHVM